MVNDFVARRTEENPSRRMSQEEYVLCAEEVLEGLAVRAKKRRYSVGVGVGILGLVSIALPELLFANEGGGDLIDDALGALFFFEAGLFFFEAGLLFALESEFEKDWALYKQRGDVLKFESLDKPEVRWHPATPWIQRGGKSRFCVGFSGTF